MKRIDPERFIFDQAEDIESGGEWRKKLSFPQEFKQNHVAHAKTECRQVDLAPAHELDQIVVASASGDGAELALPVERFEDDSGVVGQAANHVIIDFDVITETSCREIG